MKMSDSNALVAAAVLAAQRAMPAVHKTATNPHFQSRFAPLDAVMDAALAACNGADLAVMQSVADYDETGFTLNTTLLHISGQFVSGGVRFPLEKGTAQAAGSSLTYARRYSLSTLLGIVADEDEDAEIAEAPKRQSVPVVPKSPVVKASLDAIASGDKGGGIPKECPVCGGHIYDNREKKASGEFSAKGPDWSCANKECKTGNYRTGGWVKSKEAGIAEMKAALGGKPVKVTGAGPGLDTIPTALQDDDDSNSLPF